MKNLFVCVALLISVLTVSCSKENEVKPQSAPVTPTTITIEYRIQNISGQVAVDYIAPNPNSGVLELTHAEINRTEKSISFTHESGYNKYSISASNVNPSHDVVQVQIYVNGVLEVENSTTNPSQNAFAEGNF